MYCTPPAVVPFARHVLQGYVISGSLEAAPGYLVSETTHASVYQGATATTLEGIIFMRF